MLVGPWCNQPEQYEGYNGFVGWAGVTRLRSGRWLCAFSSGYWHGSPPWTDAIRQDAACRKEFEYYRSLGCMDIRCPRGGRAHVMHSDDHGLTWSTPAVLVDTDLDDRHPTILELDDGTWLCTFFSQALPHVNITRWMLSHDAGRTWSEPVNLPPQHTIGFGAGPAIQLADNTILWVGEGRFDPKVDHQTIGVFRSKDRGRTFSLHGVITCDHEMNEPTIAQLPDGRLVMMVRVQGDVSFSTDHGRSWTLPVATGVKMSDPHLLRLPNGVLACFHAGWGVGGVRVILSPDNGRTWHGPAETYGYAVDPGAYGYSHPMLLPDGTVYIVYQQNAGVRAHDARTEAIWGLVVRVHDNAAGIDILPAPGSPASAGTNVSGLAAQNPTAGYLEEGDKIGKDNEQTGER